MLNNLKTNFFLNLKNIRGWKTKKRIVVFSVDDYGNVRLHSKQAREKMHKEGLKFFSRFDAYDSLETRQDLDLLFQTLSSVKDRHGKPAIFTAYSTPCNIDFETIRKEDYTDYRSEKLPTTYGKLAAIDSNEYEGAWSLWKEGIEKGLLSPQFHGREHLNLKVFEEKLHAKDKELIVSLKNRSYTSISSTGYPTISWPAAFDFWDMEENQRFPVIIEDGLNVFEEVFGSRATNFTPPVYNCHPINYPTLNKCGIKYIDTSLIHREHLGRGKYRWQLNYTGRKFSEGLQYVVRNVVFEPGTNSHIDWVSFTLRQIEAAFRWNHPAIISSHRVNFCGHIDEGNRKIGIDALSLLLSKIVERWPDVEFLSANELTDFMT